MEKIIIQDTRKTTTIDLAGQAGGQVEIYTEFNVGQQRRMTEYKSESSFTKGLHALSVAIKEWNLYESEDQKLEITIDNMEKVLTSYDFLKITAAMTGMTFEDFTQSIEDGTLEEKVKKNITKK
jgi:hypothetical protein